MFPTIQIGPASLPTAALFLLVSIWIGLSLTDKRATWHGLKSETLDNLVLLALVGLVLGGRLAYVAIHWDTVAVSPKDIISLDENIFDLAGGLAVSLIVGLVYGQRKGVPLWPTLDALTPFFATLMIAIGTAHLANGTAFGKETSLPWGISVRGVNRHPSQVYEIAAALFILSLIGLRRPFSLAGAQFLAFVALSAATSLFLEAFRGDSILLYSGIRLGQVTAWILLAAALFGLDRLQSKQKSQEIKS
jgi:phosphatidylglycerol---prolipoprotein diacylglyceryl transferase